jgi:3-phytase
VLRGWGEFKGRFNTAVLSRYPILLDQVRVIPDIAWEDLPDNRIAEMTADLGFGVPPGFPLFEKALQVVPVQIGDDVVHLVLHHPVTPAFDDINPYRNRDELHALKLFLDGALPGVEPLPEGAKFIIIGDLNADPEDGDGIDGGIQGILEHPSVLAVFPEGAGTKGANGQRNTYLSGCGNDDGMTVADPTQKFQLQLDYLLPSATIGQPLETFLFFPDFETDREDFDLACHASDHRFLYVDLEI